MPELKAVRTSLEVGFPEGKLPDRFVRLRGRVSRSIGRLSEFPYEDAQFEVVLLDGGAVSRATVREAHRVLRSEGRLYFAVPEKTNKQEGFTLPDVYSIVREGFNIVELERPAWWRLGFGERVLTICAQKKNWRAHTNTFRPYV